MWRRRPFGFISFTHTHIYIYTYVYIYIYILSISYIEIYSMGQKNDSMLSWWLSPADFAAHRAVAAAAVASCSGESPTSQRSWRSSKEWRLNWKVDGEYHVESMDTYIYIYIDIDIDILYIIIYSDWYWYSNFNISFNFLQ